MDDIVTARADYSRLDRPGPAVRIRLGHLAPREDSARGAVEAMAMPLNSLTEKAATMFKERLESLCPGQIASVRVYGSRARGEARLDSDLDILVLTVGAREEVRSHWPDAALEVEAGLGYPFIISAQVMTREHFDELLRRERLYARSVVEEGIFV